MRRPPNQNPENSALTPSDVPAYGHRDVWRIAAPLILSNISVPLLGAVDTAVLGHLDDPRFLGGLAVGTTIFGSSGTDDYVIVTDLVSGYPRGDYDLLIEVFDARDDTFLAFIGPDESSELSLLPLEDMNRDAPAVTETRVTVNNGGGGSLGLLTLIGLAGLVLFGQVRCRPRTH